MQFLPKKTLIAIEAVLLIACRADAEPVRSKEIAQFQGVPMRYLEPLMQRLVAHHILRGVRGPKGGYLLAKERRKILLRDIMEIIEGHETPESKGLPLYNGVLLPTFAPLKDHMLAALQDITLHELCEKAAALRIKGAHPMKPDFAI